MDADPGGHSGRSRLPRILRASPDLSSKGKLRTPPGLAMEGPAAREGHGCSGGSLLSGRRFSPAWASVQGGAWQEEQGGAAGREGRQSGPLGPWVSSMCSRGRAISLINPAPSPCTPRLGPVWCPQMAWLLGPTAAHLVWGRPGVHRNSEGRVGHGGWRLERNRVESLGLTGRLPPGSLALELCPQLRTQGSHPSQRRKTKVCACRALPHPVGPQGLSPGATPTLPSLSLVVEGPEGAGQQQRVSGP